MNILFIGLGGAVGAILRYCVMLFCIKMRWINFPYATLAVNVIGSFLIAVCAFFLVERFQATEVVRAFTVIGLLGAFTTFSSFSLDTLQLFSEQRYLAAGSYVLLSIVLCLAACWLGYVLVKH